MASPQNTSPIWTIRLGLLAEKQLDRLDRPIRDRINKYLFERLAYHPNPRALGKTLVGGQYHGKDRFRVGDYRIICDIKDNELVIVALEIGHRGKIYGKPS
ncbi:MAG: type II toxin-antitoxin system RelE/ParE family toxin [Candidatus Symbiobacter sp.]|nr:type II toxin-antitoxin system RelE/ParE family toxin [Candidatus Symbiobacter sp.]